jgi:hypothetical protein
MKNRVSISALYHNIPGYSHQSSPFLPFSRRQSDDLTSQNELERLLHKLQHLGEPNEDGGRGSPILSGRRASESEIAHRRRSSSAAQETPTKSKPSRQQGETKRNSGAGPLTASFRRWSSYHSLADGKSNSKYPFGSPARYRSHDSSEGDDSDEDDDEDNSSDDDGNRLFGSGRPSLQLAALPHTTASGTQQKKFKESKTWALTELDMYLYRPPPTDIV